MEDLRGSAFGGRKDRTWAARSRRTRRVERRDVYLQTWRKLRAGGWIYPCTCSRKDLAEAAHAPHESSDEPMYPGRCRGRKLTLDSPVGVNWRFRVPDGRVVSFHDGAQGQQQYTAGKDFGDFVVWRRDDVPAYQLAVVADDARHANTEVVRGADLLKSTARQMLLCRRWGLRSGVLPLRSAERRPRASDWPSGTTPSACARCARRAIRQNSYWIGARAGETESAGP